MDQILADLDAQFARFRRTKALLTGTLRLDVAGGGDSLHFRLEGHALTPLPGVTGLSMAMLPPMPGADPAYSHALVLGKAGARHPAKSLPHTVTMCVVSGALDWHAPDAPVRVGAGEHIDVRANEPYSYTVVEDFVAYLLFTPPL